jgi:hypothetical protein
MTGYFSCPSRKFVTSIIKYCFLVGDHSYLILMSRPARMCVAPSPAAVRRRRRWSRKVLERSVKRRKEEEEDRSGQYFCRQPPKLVSWPANPEDKTTMVQVCSFNTYTQQGKGE